MQSGKAIGIPWGLSDEELVTEVQRLARLTRQTAASLVAHLAEMEARRLYLGAGCPSLFVYCTDILRLSEHEAYLRIEAARLARRFPIVLEHLADGTLTLTTARLLSPQLTAENHDTLLAAAAGKSKRAVEVLLATMFPVPDVKASIRKLPAPRPVTSADRAVGPADANANESAPATECVAAAMSAADLDERMVGSVAVGSGGTAAEPPVIEPVVASATDATPVLTRPAPGATRSRQLVRPLAADRYEIRFTARAATREKLQLASDLLRHAIPDGDVAEIVDRALTVLLEDLAKKRFAATARPASGRKRVRDATTRTRHIPADVKRRVWLRDGGCCAFVTPGGKGSNGSPRRCRERAFLEFHHVRPYAVGGEATVENIELRCRAHNGYEAELFYGGRFPASERRVSVSGGSGPIELGPDRVAAQRSAPRAEGRAPMLPQH